MIFRDESLKSAIAEAAAVAAHRSDSQLSEAILSLVEELATCNYAKTNMSLLFAGAPSWGASECVSVYSKYRDDNIEKRTYTVHWFGHRDKPPYYTTVRQGDPLPNSTEEDWMKDVHSVDSNNLNWQQRVYNWWRSWKKKRPVAAAFLVVLFPALLQSCVNNATEIAKPMEPRLEDTEAVITHKFEGNQVFVVNGNATFILTGEPQKEHEAVPKNEPQFGGMILDSLPEDSSVMPQTHKYKKVYRFGGRPSFS